MAAQLNKGPNSSRRRVFVLVDKGDAKGVFSSWDAAESYADDNRYSLDHLYEFETKPDHPDHLHLMAAQWNGVWQFAGEWSKKTATWKQPPERIRLDHYHAMGGKFHLLRQMEFKWRESVLEQINPMAPDAAMKIDYQIKSVPPPTPKPQWKPKLSPLRPIDEPGNREKPTDSPKDIKDAEEPPADNPTPRPPLMEEAPPDPPAEKEAPEALPEESPEAEPPTEPVPEERPKISFTRKNPLRLRTDRASPRPIPDFRNEQDSPPEPPTTTAGLPKPGGEPEPAVEELIEEPDESPGKPRRVWPMRLIVPVAAIVLCWAGGLYWALKPPATTQSIITDVTSLASARTLAIEPGQIFFQLEVDPIHQQRWVRSLGLLPIPFGKTFTLPQYHALDTWEKPEGFIRPPYAEVEVREWWDLRLRRISYGFFHEWEDGTVLIMDLQADLLLGWGHARNFPELMN